MGHSLETRLKIGNANRNQLFFFCDYCGGLTHDKPSAYKKKKRHFCNQHCYSEFRKYQLFKHEQHSWRGGVSSTETHRRWKRKNPERMAHLKARRYARERGAEGSHTLDEWEKLKIKNGLRCVGCNKKRKLTKDHIIPLSKGGSDFITNIQPMCGSCNSRKWKHIYENPELLPE